MPIIVVKAEDLKKAMAIATLATADDPKIVKGHALFKISSRTIFIQALNDKYISYTSIPLAGEEMDPASEGMTFSVDPKSMTTLLSSSDNKEVKISFTKETMTVDVYASEDPEAYISLPSHDPEKFVDFSDRIKEIKTIAPVDTTVLTAALKFGAGFASQDDKDPKYSNIFIREGVLQATNGTHRVGFFKVDDLAPIFSMIIRRVNVSPILNFLERALKDSVLIGESENLILFSSPDAKSGYGFTKSVIEIPKIPGSTDIPSTDGMTVNRQTFLKKINRLAIAMRGEEVNLEATLDGDSLTIHTVSDRKSVERMTCTRLNGTSGKVTFFVKQPPLKAALSIYNGDTIDIYIYKNRLIFNSVADLVCDEEGKIKKAFTATSLISTPRGPS